jgi:hypothetical protein
MNGCEQFVSLSYRHAPPQLIEEVQEGRHVSDRFLLRGSILVEDHANRLLSGAAS